MKKNVIQLLKFFLCTQAAWLLDLGVYTLMFEVLKLNYILSKAISYSLGAALSYTLNRSVTFLRRGSVKSTLPKFITVNICALLTSLSSMYVMGDILGLDEWICYFLSVIFSFSVNYFGNKLWVFKEEKNKNAVKN